MDFQTATSITKGLSETSKMPGFSYSLPASMCKTGRALSRIEGTVCSRCYACRGFYRFSNVKPALEARAQAITDPRWVEAMAFLLNHKLKVGIQRKTPGYAYFRWHDSGDLQDEKHLLKIFEVCRLTPEIKHWLPSKEHVLIRKVLKTHKQPKNLVIRFSAHYIDQVPAIKSEAFCTVHTPGKEPRGAAICTASSRGGACGPCRDCWHPLIIHVSYPLTNGG